MNKIMVDLKKAVSGAVFIAATTAASGAGAAHILPEFHFMGQMLASESFSSPDVDIFGLGGLEDISAYNYEASFESTSGAGLGLFTVVAMDTPFEMPDVMDALGGAFFGAAVVDPKFSFTTSPGKYHYAIVSGISGSMPTSYNLHVIPVPEAETWAMMLVGLGLVGGIAYRRRNDAVVARLS